MLGSRITVDRSAAKGRDAEGWPKLRRRRGPVEAENADALRRPAAVGSTAPPRADAYGTRSAEATPPKPRTGRPQLCIPPERRPQPTGAAGGQARWPERRTPRRSPPPAGRDFRASPDVGAVPDPERRRRTVDRSAALAEGTAVARSYGSADAPPEPRTLAPRVGLQRWVLQRPSLTGHLTRDPKREHRGRRVAPSPFPLTRLLRCPSRWRTLRAATPD